MHAKRYNQIHSLTSLGLGACISQSSSERTLKYDLRTPLSAVVLVNAVVGRIICIETSYWFCLYVNALWQFINLLHVGSYMMYGVLISN